MNSSQFVEQNRNTDIDKILLTEERSLPHTGTSLTNIALIYGVCVVFGVIANLMIIYIVWRHKDMHTTTNYFFCNLALTDVCFLLFYGVPSTVVRTGILIKDIWLCRVIHFSRLVRLLLNNKCNICKVDRFVPKEFFNTILLKAGKS